MEKSDLERKEKELESLIKKLADKAKGRYPIFDGINNIDQYLAAQYKIVFVLKEPYDGSNGTGGGFAIKKILDFDGYGKGSKTFAPMIYIATSILNGFLSFDQIESTVQENFKMKTNDLYKVAHINIGKLPSKKETRTSFTDIKDAYTKDRQNDQIILKQIDAYEPDFIIGCGIQNLLNSDLELYKEESLHGLRSKKYPNLLYIGTYHPSQTTIKRPVYCNHVIDLARAWATKRNNNLL